MGRSQERRNILKSISQKTGDTQSAPKIKIATTPQLSNHNGETIAKEEIPENSGFFQMQEDTEEPTTSTSTSNIFSVAPKDRIKNVLSTIMDQEMEEATDIINASQEEEMGSSSRTLPKVSEEKAWNTVNQLLPYNICVKADEDNDPAFWANSERDTEYKTYNEENEDDKKSIPIRKI